MASEFLGHNGPILSLCTLYVPSLDLHLLFSSGSDSNLCIWNIETGKLLSRSKTSVMPYFLRVLLVKPEKIAIFTAGDDQKIFASTFHPGNLGQNVFVLLEETSMVHHSSNISSLCVVPEKCLVSGSFDKNICIWDIVNIGQRLNVCSQHTNTVTSICCSPTDSDNFASASLDGTILVWSIKDGRCLKTINVGIEITSLVWVTGDIFIGGCKDGRLLACHEQEQTGIVHFPNRSGEIKSLCWLSGSNKIATVSNSQTLSLNDWYNAVSLGIVKNEPLRGFKSAITALTASRDGKMVFTGHQSGGIFMSKVLRNQSSTATDVDIRAILVARKWKELKVPDEIIETTDKPIFSRAVNDSSRFGIDRLGYTSYAQAIFNVVDDVQPPFCVGLYGRWGVGKTFMIQRLKHNFDNSVNGHPYTEDRVQWFEDGWTPSAELQPADNVQNNTVQSTGQNPWSFRCKLLHSCWLKILSYIGKVVGNILKMVCALTCVKFISNLKIYCCWSFVIIPKLLLNSTYLGAIVWELLSEDLIFFKQKLFPQKMFDNVVSTMWSCYKGRALNAKEPYDVENQWEYHAGCMCCCCYCFGLGCCYSTGETAPQNINNVSEVNAEYVFVDFNAWEFSRSDELWTGLIRNIYNKVELRLERHNHSNYFLSGLPKRHTNSNTKRQDMKQKWRVTKAKELLIKHYGSIWKLRFRVWSLLFFAICSLVVILLSAFGLMDFWENVVSTVSNVFSIISGVIAVVAALPSVRLLLQAYSSVNTSRGEAIFEEANRGIKDTIGFMAQVRLELEELFGFMRQYTEESHIQLKLVVFVDDLDRCLGDRPVKVLEAIQLLLAIPGAPVICFLAIDSRIVVASIEHTINKSLPIEDALISGWEYMDKIVQLPFCFPEPSVDNVQRYIDSCINKVDNVKTICEMLVDLRSEIVENTKYYDQPLCLKFSGKPTLGKNVELTIKCEEYLQIIPDYYPNNIVTCTNTVKQFALKLNCSYCSDWVKLYDKSCRSHNDCAVSNDEALEEICNIILQYLKTLTIDREATSSNIGNVNGTGRSTILNVASTGNATNPAAQTVASSTLSNNTAAPPSTTSSLDYIVNIFEVKKSTILEKATKPLLPLQMYHTLKVLCREAESNARRFKRVLNVVTIVHKVATCKSSSYNSEETLSMDDRWYEFSAKITKWIFLCEFYPFRMSFLVQLLTDWEQKREFNEDLGEHCGAWFLNGEEYVMRESLCEMDIGRFFYLYVEKHLFTISSAKKLMRLDSDPELFASLIFKTISPSNSSRSDFQIKCGDVLGMNSQPSLQRDPNFALLTYAFNLNPSMSRQIAMELQHCVSDITLTVMTNENPELPKILNIPQSDSLPVCVLMDSESESSRNGAEFYSIPPPPVSGFGDMDDEIGVHDNVLQGSCDVSLLSMLMNSRNLQDNELGSLHTEDLKGASEEEQLRFSGSSDDHDGRKSSDNIERNHPLKPNISFKYTLVAPSFENPHDNDNDNNNDSEQHKKGNNEEIQQPLTNQVENETPLASDIDSPDSNRFRPKSVKDELVPFFEHKK